MNKNGFKLEFELDKFTLTNGGLYVGWGNLLDGKFKLNVLAQVPKNNKNKNKASTYTIDLCDVWYYRLGHVNYQSLQRMVNLELFPNFSIDKRHKCEVCVELKFTRNLFPSMERNSELLDLIHSDVCDMKSTSTRSEKKYFITFIDDCSKYCYVYLLHSKDKTLDVFKAYKVEVENQLGKEVKVLRSDRGGE